MVFFLLFFIDICSLTGILVFEATWLVYYLGVVERDLASLTLFWFKMSEAMESKGSKYNISTRLSSDLIKRWSKAESES